MTDNATHKIAWRTSTRSSNAGGQCVEIGASSLDIIAVRDTKNRSGGTLSVPASEWVEWVSALKQNAFGT